MDGDLTVVTRIARRAVRYRRVAERDGRQSEQLVDGDLAGTVAVTRALAAERCR